jgi:hypothetical protein
MALGFPFASSNTSFTWTATKKLLAERGVQLLGVGLDEVLAVLFGRAVGRRGTWAVMTFPV